MASQASRSSSFSKFTLKPSSLSGLTANFNKKLEQIPVLKESIDLIGKDSTLVEPKSNQENISQEEPAKPNPTQAGENTASSSGNQEAASSKQFLFGENITERVVNTATPVLGEAAGESGEGDKSEEKPGIPTSSSSNNVTWLNDAESAEKYASAIHESDLYSLFKLNCRLYVLEADKANWAERGYGLLKVIETSDGNNCKIMMWTDKCYRLILNTKLFEKMKIDRANKKSLRLNAFDNGTIRIFLIKTSNPSDCDELYNILTTRLELFNSSQSKIDLSQDDSQSKSPISSSTGRKLTKLKCECLVTRDSNSVTARAKLHLYSLDLASSSDSPTRISNSHQLFLDINEANESEPKINLNSFLKLVKIKKQRLNSGKKHNRRFLEFQVVDIAQTRSNIKYKVCINDREAAGQFLSLFKKEPKLTSLDDSSNGANAFDKDGEPDQDANDDQEEDEEDTSETTETDDEDDIPSNSSSEEAEESSFPDESLDRTNTSSVDQEPSRTKRKSDACEGDLPSSFKKQDLGKDEEKAAAESGVGPSGRAKRNLEESVNSEGDSSALDESNQSPGMKKSKVDGNEESNDVN